MMDDTDLAILQQVPGKYADFQPKA